MKTPFQPIDSSLLYSRNDQDDIRLGDIGKLAPPIETASDAENLLAEFTEKQVVILGYPDDDGIAANGGRRGAKEAPNRIRNYLYRMTPPAVLTAASKHPALLDLGNLNCSDLDLRARHDAASAVASLAIKNGHRVISLGGGHDYGYPDAVAYARKAMHDGFRPLVINFDAHLDVRSDQKGINSGTPFFRLLEAVPETEVITLGLQSQCNSIRHRDWLVEHGGTASFEEARQAAGHSLVDTLIKTLGDRALKRQPVFISVDIDAFSSSVAPGASQSWPTGLMPNDFFQALSWCLARFDVPHLGIYEVSPALDVDDRTSRLAALIAYRFMFQLV